MLKGKKVYLEAVEAEDLELLRMWRNNPEYRKYFREYREISKDMQKKWFETKVLKDPATIMFSIKKEGTRELLGCCGLCYINWIHRNSDLSLYIGWKDSYIDQEGYAKESCKLLFEYGFYELGLKKIWTEIYEFDNSKNDLYRSLGFHEDGRLRAQYFYDGKWWDSFLLSLLSDEYKLNN